MRPDDHNDPLMFMRPHQCWPWGGCTKVIPGLNLEDGLWSRKMQLQEAPSGRDSRVDAAEGHILFSSWTFINLWGYLQSLRTRWVPGHPTCQQQWC